jgi:hypothetical protein
MATPEYHLRPRTLLAPLALAALLTFVSTPASARSAVADPKSPAIFVRVLDITTGMPVGGAEVIVNYLGGDPDRPIVTGVIYNRSSNAGGHAFFHGLQRGGYVVSVRARGYVSFGDGAHGDRLPTGERVIVAFRFGAGAAGTTPAHVIVRLVPICADCRVSS